MRYASAGSVEILEQIVEQTWNRIWRNWVKQVQQQTAKSLRGKDGQMFVPAHNPKVGGSNPPPATNTCNNLGKPNHRLPFEFVRVLCVLSHIARFGMVTTFWACAARHSRRLS